MGRKAGKPTTSTKAGATTSGATTATVGLSGAIVGTGDLPDSHALLLGRLFAKTTIIEAELEALIWLLAGLEPPIGRLFTQHLDARRRRERVDELLGVVAAPARAKELWSKTKPHITKAITHRNDFAHSVALRFGGPSLLMSTRGAPEGSVYKTKIAPEHDTQAAVTAAEKTLDLLKELSDLIAGGQATPVSP
jgi:hypothetical protein